MQLTPEVLAALDYIGNTAEMRVFRQWLKEQVQSQTIGAIKATENVDLLRGYAHALMDLSDVLENTTELKKRLENRNGKAKKPNNSGYPGRSH